MSGAYDIVPVSAVEAGALATAIGEAFGKPRSLEWFVWKHCESPWGRSTGWVAVDDDGVLGLRLFTPWQLTVDGVPQTMHRAMDGAVVPRARRRGIFQALVNRQMALSDGGSPQLLFSTAVPASQAAYEKLGWTVLPRVQHRWVFTPPSPTAGFTEVEVGDLVPAAGAATGTATLWNIDALSWRVDPRSGHQYRAGTLSTGDDVNGIVWREQGVGARRSVVEILCWGANSDRQRLRRAVCWTSRTPIRVVVGADSGRFGLQRGGSTVAIWARDDPSETSVWGRAADGDGWVLDFADVEGVM